MNLFGYEAAGWIFQQDYLTFLAVLGWLTAGLIAWGEAAAGSATRTLPLKWFAFFCFFAALDGTLDLARMIAPQVWPREFDPALRLAGYGYLLEFARQTAARHGWLRVPIWVPPLVAALAQGVIIVAPVVSPGLELAVGLVAGVAAGAVIAASVTKGSRVLLLVAAVLPLLGPRELLRTPGGTPIDGLYGLAVTGEGFAAALCAAVLAWLAAVGLWLHGVLRRRHGVFTGRREMASPVVGIVLPAVLAATLAAGFFLVNWSSQRARGTIQRDYLNRARTAALAVDPELLARAVQSGVPDPYDPDLQKVRQQIRALQSISDDVLRAYLVVGGRILQPAGWLASQSGSSEEAAILRTGAQNLPAAGNAHLLGPVGSRDRAITTANAPVLDARTRGQLAWLGIHIAADEWLLAQALARLQTIALVGLFAFLVVFFLAHVMLREYEADLLIDKERAEAADRAKDEFLAVMSHEIRTPMQSVLGYGELMARTPLTAAQTGFLETIRAQGRTLLRIVQDILDFSTLRKSSYTLKRETVYLPRLVESAFEGFRPLAARRELRFEYTIANDVPEVVEGDAVRIEQILLNLLNNALKFTDRGGVQLDVSLERTETGPGGTVSWVLFSISDTGLGIRPGDISKLFQPFTRLSADDNVPREGTGLGLAIVKRLCELMSGRIALESTWGKGTRFFVRLPLMSVAPSSAAAGAPAGDPSAPPPPVEILHLGSVLPLEVLVAEDNPYIRRLMIEYLRSIGYEPVAVGSGADAAERWREFDLLVMDLRMPGMDGITAAERIRAASGSTTQPWIIGVSATLAEAEIERAMQAGMNDFLGKPFFVQSLIEAIQASPLYARRTDEPPVAALAGESRPAADGDAAADTDDDVPPAPPAGVMSWMPNLAADGENEIVQQAIAEIPEVMQEIAAALDRKDLPTAADRAHYLKNTVFALRIEPMVAPCRSVFERAQAGDLPSARQSLDTLRAAFDGWRHQRATPGSAEAG